MHASVRSLGIMLRWRYLVRRREFGTILVLQSLVSVGVVMGFGFIAGPIDTERAQYVVTAAATLNVAMGGLVVVPQNVASARQQGTFDYFLALPIPRLNLLLADLLDTMTTSLPGVAMALIAGSLRYGFVLDPSVLVIPAIALVALTGAGIGYSLAVLSPSPHLTQLLTQVIIFGLFLFSPIAFPADRLPAPLAALHAVLPVRHMADAVREGLTQAGSANIALALAVLSLWCLPAIACSQLALSRRR